MAQLESHEYQVERNRFRNGARDERPGYGDDYEPKIGEWRRARVRNFCRFAGAWLRDRHVAHHRPAQHRATKMISALMSSTCREGRKHQDRNNKDARFEKAAWCRTASMRERSHNLDYCTAM